MDPHESCAHRLRTLRVSMHPLMRGTFPHCLVTEGICGKKAAEGTTSVNWGGTPLHASQSS